MKEPLNNSNFVKAFINNRFLEVSNDSDYCHPFFMIEIIKRRKDNLIQEDPTESLKIYEIYSVEDFDKYLPEIIEKCERHNARAYFHVNIKDSRAVMNNMLSLMSAYNNFNANNLQNLPKVFHKAAGLKEANIKEQNQYWVIDFDWAEDFNPNNCLVNEDEMYQDNQDGPKAFYEDGFIQSVRKIFLDEITQYLSDERKAYYNNKCFVNKSPNGFHLIVPPFDVTAQLKRHLLKHLGEEIKGFDDCIEFVVRLNDMIKKNNMTLLYMPS